MNHRRLCGVVSVLVGAIAPLAIGQAPAADAPAAVASVQPLRIGDKAPKIEVGTWVKGEAVTGFAADRIYIVEFWATWCGPCKRAFPHLSELQAKHKDKLTVVSVSIWEAMGGAESHENIVSKVRGFVEMQKPPMEYTIGVDTAQNAMATNWMAAAGKNSIPNAFIIVGGAIAWMGNPLGNDFDETLRLALEGKIDVKAEAERAAKQEAAIARYNEVMARSIALKDEGKFAEAVAALDAGLKDETDRDVRGSLLRTKFNFLSMSDEPAAYALAAGLLDGEFKDSENELSMLSEAIAGNDALKKPDFALAVRLSERANTLAQGRNTGVLYRLATAYYKSGDVDKAIAAQQSAIDRVKEQVGEEKGGPMIAILNQRLEEWKKAAGK